MKKHEREVAIAENVLAVVRESSEPLGRLAAGRVISGSRLNDKYQDVAKYSCEGVNANEAVRVIDMMIMGKVLVQEPGTHHLKAAA